MVRANCFVAPAVALMLIGLVVGCNREQGVSRGDAMVESGGDDAIRANISRIPQLPFHAKPLDVRPPTPDWALGMVAWAAVDGRGLTYLLQRNENMDPVVVVDADGNVVRSWGKGLFVFPHSIRIDPHGNVWTTDAMSSMVYKFSASGRKLLEIAVEGKPKSCDDSCGATDVAFAPNGHVFIADGYLNARILEYTADGQKVNEWGTSGTGPGQLRQPHSIVIDDAGVLYEADRLNSRVQRFDLSGRYLGAWLGFGKSHAIDVADGAVWLSTQLPGVANLSAPGWVLKVDGATGRPLGRIDFAGGHGIEVSRRGEQLLVVPGPSRTRPTWFRQPKAD